MAGSLVLPTITIGPDDQTPPPPGPGNAPLDITPQDRDLMTRTVLGEAGNQSDEGKAAVAHVIVNRLKSGKYGNSAKDVVLAPHQFEPWQTRGPELMGYNPTSDAYKNTAAVVDHAISGGEDPTGGATHFLNPKIAQARRGGTLPDWANGDSTTIGDHTFYNPGGKLVKNDFTPVGQVFGSPAAAPQQDSGFTPVGDVLPAQSAALPAGAQPAQQAAPNASPTNQWTSTEIEGENKQLAGSQFTLPYFGAHKDNLVGDAVIGDDNQVYTHGPNGQWVPTDKNKQVVLRDPSDGKYKVFNRTEDTDLGPISGRALAIGGLINEGAATAPLGGIAAPLSAGEKAAKAAGAIEKATGVAVNVPKTGVTESTIPRVVERTISHIPGGGGPMTRGAEGMAGGLDSAAHETAALPTGVVGSAEEAGQAARFGINERIKPGEEGMFNQATKSYYDKVDSLIKDPAARSPLTNTLAKVQDIASRFSATEREGLPESIKSVLGAVTHPEGLTYQALKDLRTSVGEDIKQVVNSGMSNGELKQIYGSLTDDLRATIQSQGGKRGVAAWEKANAQAAVVARSRERLAKVIGVKETSKSDEAIFNTLHRMAGSTASADAKTLALARRSMSPSEWSEVSSGVAARLGRAGGAADGAFNPTKFVSDYAKLSPAGKNLMFGEGTQMRKALDAITELSGKPWSQAKEVAKPPGEVGHLVGLAGIWHHLTGALGAISGANVMARILSRGNTAENAAKMMRSEKLMRLTPTRTNVIAFNNAARVLTTDAASTARDQLGWAKDKAEEFAGNMLNKIVQGAADTIQSIRGK